ncbi:MAG: hypothetical protein KAV83_08530 [Desulfobacterales bacterium]|nr:hypothetical protein [Desulfobacterales bacterium]
MCVPVSGLTTGTPSGGCQGICRVWPQIIGLLITTGVLIWNFTRSLGKKLSSEKEG